MTDDILPLALAALEDDINLAASYLAGGESTPIRTDTAPKLARAVLALHVEVIRLSEVEALVAGYQGRDHEHGRMVKLAREQRDVAEAERDALRAELERLKADVAYVKFAAALGIDPKAFAESAEAMRAEVERMRPVFEAAKAWRREISKPGAYGRVGDTRLDLEESIDAAAAKETK